MKCIYSIATVALIPNCSAVKLEREPLLAWAPTPKADEFKMNYGVSHFGEDKEISYTKKNIADAEQKLGHILDTSDPPADPKRNYFVPNFGADQEAVLDFRQSLTAAEKLNNHELQISEYPKIDRNYFVPHFGEDHDIKKSKDSESLAQSILGHTWTPVKDEDGKWDLPSPQIEFELIQTMPKKRQIDF